MKQRVRIPLEDGGELFLLPAYLGGNVLPVRLSPRPSKAPVYELYVGHGWVSTALSAGELGDLLDGDEDVDDDPEESSSELEDQDSHELGSRIAKLFGELGEEYTPTFMRLGDERIKSLADAMKFWFRFENTLEGSAVDVRGEALSLEGKDPEEVLERVLERGPRSFVDDGEKCAHGVSLYIACDACAEEGYTGEAIPQKEQASETGDTDE